MDDNTTVIVALPTYNNEDTVGTTIDLVLDQSRTPDRIVVCDKSSDSTREVIKARSEETDVEIEILEQTSDGVAGAYDEILDHVSGTYDLFFTIQSDLTVKKDWLEGHIRLHENHPEIGIVNGDYRGNEPTDGEISADERPYYIGRNFSAKAGVLESIDGWDANFLRGEDWDMRIRLSGANVRSYARTSLGYEWQTSDPYITLSKAKRRPTSVSFLSKYGSWYLTYHPSHVISDLLSFGLLASLTAAFIFFPVVPVVSALALVGVICSVIAYWIGHVVFRGGVDGNLVLGPIRKQLLNGVSVIYAIYRVVGEDTDWNTSGFVPANIPRYKF